MFLIAFLLRYQIVNDFPSGSCNKKLCYKKIFFISSSFCYIIYFSPFFLFLFSLFFFLSCFQQTRKACITTELRIYLKANAIYIRTTTIFWSHSFTDKNAFSFSLLLNDFLSFGSECIVFIY